MHSQSPAEESRQALQDIRSIMQRSERFLSLSGWSGVWAGATALVAAFIAYRLIQTGPLNGDAAYRDGQRAYDDLLILQMGGLALITFCVALAGGLFFTLRKAKAEGATIYSPASRQLFVQIMIPMIAGGIFCLAFLRYDAVQFIAPACLAFYGLALVNGSKYTLGDIRYLGYLEVALGCICLFVPYYGIAFLAAGFGVLHILYGIIMWNKYDKHRAA